MRILTSTLALVAALLLVHPALAGTKSGVTMPDQIELEGQTLTLNGMGTREATALGIDVYVAGLYLPRATQDPARVIGGDELKRLHLVFVRDVSRNDITKAWREGFEKNAAASMAALKPRIDTLNSYMPAFEKGDTLTFTYYPDHGTEVMVNGQRRGFIEGQDFARALFAVWFGDKPPNQGLKRGLLGR